MINRYRAFGLTIESDVALPELPLERDDKAAPQLSITKTDFGEDIPPLGGQGRMDFDSVHGVEMMWPGAVSIRIRDNSKIEVQPYPGVPETYLAFPLLGPVMGWVLHRRGLFVLHGSGVYKGGMSAVFLGDKGAGKSTTASAFLQQDWQLVTDDLLAIETGVSGKPQIQPAFAQIKLNADTPQVGIPGATVLPLVMEGFEKRQYRLPSIVSGPLAVDCIFVLERGGEQPHIEWLDPIDAIGMLVRYGYIVRFPTASLGQQDRPRQFRQVAAIANSARVGRLRIPHERGRLAETVDYVTETIAELAKP